jgi:hypothetical protein
VGVHIACHDRPVSWPPKIGEPLPRADRAWHEPLKLEEWVLAERGHGEDWQRVFHVGFEDREALWETIVSAVQGARITTVRDKGTNGIVCGVEVEVTIGEHTAPVTISWHYASEESTPRLVTAYVTL